MLSEYGLTTSHQGFHNITAMVKEAVQESGIMDGTCTVFCPHTTAAITINENADPDVVHDMLIALEKAFPDRGEFRHAEGNSAAHIKASCIGASVTVIVNKGKLLLGTWQGIYFCEFDGPRSRHFFVKTQKD